ncbi:MAG: GAF domain-containing protein, partial [Chloroflexi bacterium]|nr:GAF domain-containing protein [Chloroflexota bacterium]
SEAIENGRTGLAAFVRSILKASLLVELLPLPLGALIAYLFVTLDRSVFLLIALGIVLASIAVQGAADLSQANLRRERELQTLNDFSHATTEAQLDEAQIIELVYEHVSRVMDASNFAISLIDERSGQVDLALWYRDGLRQPPRRYPQMGGLAGSVAEQRVPLLVRDLDREPLPLKGLPLTAKRTRSALFAPMTATEKVLGVISVQSDLPNRFTRDHESILTAIAHQTALAVEQARLYRAERRRATQLATIAEVSQRVAGIYELDELLEFVVALVKVNFEYYHVDIYLRDGDVLMHQAGTEAQETSHAYVAIQATSLITTVARTGEALVVNDVQTEPRFRMDPAAPNTRAELIVPLKAEGKTLGVLEVQSDRVDGFHESDTFVMQTLGDQVALAIQEAELFMSVQQEAYTANALLQVAEAVGSLTSEDEILQTVVSLTPLLVGMQRCLILLNDPNTNELIGRASYGLDGALEREFAFSRVPIDMLFPSGEHPSSAPFEVRLPQQLVRRWQMASAIVLPLGIRGTPLGAFVVDSTVTLDPRRVALLAGVANQTALAIETVQLEVDRDLRARLDQELTIARAIQS